MICGPPNLNFHVSQHMLLIFFPITSHFCVMQKAEREELGMGREVILVIASPLSQMRSPG